MRTRIAALIATSLAALVLSAVPASAAGLDGMGQAIFDNSFGIFNFPSASPFGFNGRYLYIRTEIEAP